MCNAGGLKTDGFTSCRLPGQVIINQDRWQDAVPALGVRLRSPVEALLATVAIDGAVVVTE